MANISLSELSQELRAAINDLQSSPEIKNVGLVTKIGDGIVWIYGLADCGYNEMIAIESTQGEPIYAFALNLEEDQIGAVLLGDERYVSAGAKARLTGKPLAVPVGPELVGRVVDPLGNPIDGLGPIKASATSPVEKIAPGVITRQSVKQSLMTGIKAVDAIIPIGRGQRELIIGDRQTGKTAVAVDAIVNQHRQQTGVISIYVSIGQKKSKVARIVDRLRQEGAMDSTIVVLTSASDPAALQYIAPYAGCAMGEYFRDNKQDALIIYDDLSKHAWAYRQVSLLLRRPPGREAYPGDVFYIHSRLLERAAKLSDAEGGGSLTALPIIETQANDVSAYIPTNVISITDGQIYLESDLFYQGIRPAINVGLSVSRVGGAAQSKAMKSVAGPLRLELAQYRELAAFAQLSTDLDPDTKKRIDRGRRLTEVLKQGQYEPMSLSDQLVVLLAATSGAFDNVRPEQVPAAAQSVLDAAHAQAADILKNVAASGEISDADKNKLISLAQATTVSLSANGATKP
ncbi:MAG: F0F1 ATP synthase subunit alpha [Candidatus Andersenbacteria bacterium]|nr:F0F1 ATP synthase subunit alpha [bacterium]MDZ4225434.1 F0F1 ATP synthase subunit alpha [Candidatus Andersenbacteria bacterium]